MKTTEQRLTAALERVDHLGRLAQIAADCGRPGRSAAYLVTLVDELVADHLVELRRAAAGEARRERSAA
jgi:hypothetical protein